MWPFGGRGRQLLLRGQQSVRPLQEPSSAGAVRCICLFPGPAGPVYWLVIHAPILHIICASSVAGIYVMANPQVSIG
jgi:hypothetical protein